MFNVCTGYFLFLNGEKKGKDNNNVVQKGQFYTFIFFFINITLFLGVKCRY